MNRVKGLSVRVLQSHRSEFGDDFVANKRALDKMAIITSKGLKNEIAGYITRMIKREQLEMKERQEREASLAEEAAARAQEDAHGEADPSEAAAEPTAERADSGASAETPASHETSSTAGDGSGHRQELPDSLFAVDDGEITECQERLANALKAAGEYKPAVVGHQGNAFDSDVLWIKERGLWWGYSLEQKRHWNGFGRADGERDLTQGQRIVCEINPPISADNKQTAGRFAKDAGGRYYICHTGWFNVGSKRTGLNDFEEWPKARIADDKEVLVVSALDDEDLVSNLDRFVRTVDGVKSGYQ